MIVGHGMLAKQFAKYNHDTKVVIFASGVSNSLETRESEYLRERDLLSETIRNNDGVLLVYFSTCSMYDPVTRNSEYVIHKIAMERLIQDNSKKYLILRVSQVVGYATNATLINYLVNHIKSGQKFIIWKNSTRNLIDVDDLYKIACYLIDNGLELNKIIHIANSQSMSILDIVNCIENTLGIQAHYDLLENGAEYSQIPNDIAKYISPLNISFHNDYCNNVINKYVK